MPTPRPARRATLPCPTCGRPLTVYQPTGPDDRRQSRLQCRTQSCPLALEDDAAFGARL